MKREEFEMLPMDKRIIYINEQLQSGLPMKQIAEQLNYNDSTLRKQLNIAGYKMKGGLYTNVTTDVTTNVTTEVNQVDADFNLKVMQELSIDEMVAMIKNNPHLLMQTMNQEMSIIYKRLEAIEKGIEARNTNVSTNAIAIDIPDGEMKLVSFRLNETVYEQWKQFTSDQKVYRSQDLLAMAIIEYMDKYR